MSGRDLKNRIRDSNKRIGYRLYKIKIKINEFALQKRHRGIQMCIAGIYRNFMRLRGGMSEINLINSC